MLLFLPVIRDEALSQPAVVEIDLGLVRAITRAQTFRWRIQAHRVMYEYAEYVVVRSNLCRQFARLVINAQKVADDDDQDIMLCEAHRLFQCSVQHGRRRRRF